MPMGIDKEVLACIGIFPNLVANDWIHAIRMCAPCPNGVIDIGGPRSPNRECLAARTE